MARQPLIAVTATTREESDVERVRLTAAYLRVLERVGLIPIVVPPASEETAAAAAGSVLAAVAGLVLTGGEDVDPRWYGAAPSPRGGVPHRARDATEIALIRTARAQALPTLAICRGIQIVNVACGGSLIQDIPTERSGALNHKQPSARDARTHAVRVEAGTRTADALGASVIAVNSFHHQAVDRLGAGLRVTAHAPDGIVEGVESAPDDPWWLTAVQWHPEEFVTDGAAIDHGIFRAFAAAVSSGAASASRRIPAGAAGRANGDAGRDSDRSPD